MLSAFVYAGVCDYACVSAVLLRGGLPAHFTRCQHPVRQVRADWRVRGPVQRTGFQFQPRAESTLTAGESSRSSQ